VALDDRRHPDAERLAEYADGVLDAGARADVERHLADCPECRAAVMETMTFLETVPAEGEAVSAATVVPFRSRRWVTTVAAGLAAAAVLAIAIVIDRPARLFGPRSDRPELQELIAAVANEPTRPVEGRLSGGFKYAPSPSATRGAEANRVSPDVRIAAAKLEKLASATNDPRAHAAVGAGYLAIRDYDKGVSELERAVAGAREVAAYQSDLSAAYLARARWRNRPEDWPRALAAAERAIRANPAQLEAYFNRALALDALHLTDDADRAWREYVERDSASGWSAEVKDRSRQKESFPQSRTERPSLEALVGFHDPASVQVAARRNPDDVKRVVRDEVIAAWAATSRTPNPAASERSLDRALEIAEIFTAATGNALDRDALAAVKRQPAHRERFARAYDEYQAAMVLYRAYRFDEARGRFDRASAAFAALGSPYASLNSLYASICLYHANQFDSAEVPLRALSSAPADEVAGQAIFTRALIEGNRGRYAETLALFASAQGLFARIHADEDVVNVLASRAETLRLLGQERGAWQEELAALSQLQSVSSPARRQAVFYVGAVISEFSGLAESALYFGRAFVGAARESGSANAIAEALSHLARSYVRLGRLRDAADVLADGRRLLRGGGPRSEQFIEANMLTVDARLSAASEPQRSLQPLDQAIAYFTAAHRELLLPDLLLQRGKVNERLGQFASARDDFGRGLSVVERNRARLIDSVQRIDYAEDSAPLLDGYVRIGIANQTVTEALEAVERIRALDSAGGDRACFEAGEASARVQPGITVVSFFLGEHDVVIGVARHGRTNAVVNHVDRDAVADLVQRYGSPGESPVAGFVDDTERRVAEILIGPVAAHLDSSDTLVIVPDSLLWRVPFAALRNPRTGRRLIEEHPIAYASSLHAVVCRPEQTSWRHASALLVAAPEAVDVDGSSLPLLTGTIEEVGDVGRLYGHAAQMVGQNISRASFLSRVWDSDVVHIAAHAIADPERPALSRLLLTKDPSDAVLFHALRPTHAARPAIIVLAACGSAAGRWNRAGLSMSLARTFIDAGVDAVVASIWPVPDEPARHLFVEFHKMIVAGSAPADALRDAQLFMIRSGDAALSDPRAWAGVEVVGGFRTRDAQRGSRRMHD
jgi:CHAT domain-containing protein